MLGERVERVGQFGLAGAQARGLGDDAAEPPPDDRLVVVAAQPADELVVGVVGT